MKRIMLNVAITAALASCATAAEPKTYKMTTPIGMVGTVPTATDSRFAGKQLRLRPENTVQHLYNSDQQPEN